MRRIYGIRFEFIWNYSDIIVNWIGFNTAVYLFGLLIYLELDLFGTWNPLWNKDNVYVRSSSVRLIFVTVFDFGPQHQLFINAFSKSRAEYKLRYMNWQFIYT